MTPLKSLFLLDPEITYLNFGSFGACPKPIFDDYQKWQLELETEPAQFIQVNGPEYLRQARVALAKFINCHEDDLVFTTNPSYALNIITKSLKLNAGDEILSTNLEYGAMDRAWDFYCEKSNAKYVRSEITLPLTSKEKFIEDFFKGLSPKTKAIFISQITSATGLILPVQEICDIAKSKGLMTIVDGAHSAAHVPVDLQKLNPDVFAGACHKWMMTPKGSSFLYVKRELQELFEPLVISWGYKSIAPSHSKFLDYHQFNGTRDFSAFLTIPKSIEFMKEHNWWSVAKSCRELVLKNADRFCSLSKKQALAPLTEEFFAQLFSIPVDCSEPEKLQKTLFNQYKIEIPVMRQGNSIYIRYSINAFNDQEDLDRLFEALKRELR